METETTFSSQSREESIHTTGLLGLDRDNDPATLLLRTDTELGLDLDDFTPQSNMSTYATSTTSVTSASESHIFTASQRGSTNPTSAYTGYGGMSARDKGRIVINRSPSESATWGSGSGSEHDGIRHIGCWADPELKLRKHAVRRSATGRKKKPEIVLHQLRQPTHTEEEPLTATSLPESKILSTQDSPVHVESGPLAQGALDARRTTFSLLRTIIMIVSLLIIIISFTTTAFKIHYLLNHEWTPKVINALVLKTTTTIAFFTITFMVAASCALYEILHTLLLQMLMYLIFFINLQELS